MNTLWRDLVFSVRTLRRSPLFTGVAVISLALGIGATTAIFSLMDQVLVRLLPVREPRRLVLLHRDYQPQGTSTSDDRASVFSYPMYRELRDHDPAFEGVIARAGAPVAVSYLQSTQPAYADVISGNYFEALGVGAMVGRVIASEDDGAPGAHPVIVLSHGYWTSRFGKDPRIVGKTIEINSHPMTVIGVASPQFNGLRSGSSPDLYVPIAMQKAVKPTWDALGDASFRWLHLFARLKPGMSLQQAQAATNVAYRPILEAELARTPNEVGPGQRNKFLSHKLELQPASQGINNLRREWEKPLIATMAMACLVLLIACANVAGLMLARAAGRQRDISIRNALGANRWAVVRQLLAESALLSLLAGTLGLFAAYLTSLGLIHVLPEDFTGNWLKATVDVRMLGFALATSACCSLLFGLVPALQATRPDVSGTLKNSASAISSHSGGPQLRKLMVTGQVALSLTLLIGAALFAQSLFELLKVNLGFRSDHLLAFRIDATLTRPSVASALSYYHDLQDQLSRLGGIQGVAASTSGPLSQRGDGTNITVEGYRIAENSVAGAEKEGVSAGFFESMGIPLRKGRDFTERDRAGAPKVVVVNETFVKKYFGEKNPIGRHMMFGGGNHPVLDREIVGVAADIHKEIREQPAETVYYPYAQEDNPPRLIFYIRTGGSETQIGPRVRRTVSLLDPRVPMDDLNSMTLLIRNSIYTDRLVAILSTAFGVLATILAAIGLYGVVGYVVARRTNEIGIRMALGALPTDVLRLVLGEAGAMVAVGVVAGLGGGVALGRFIQSQLFGIHAASPVLLGSAAMLLMVITLGAALIPARRAAQIDPVCALKYE